MPDPSTSLMCFALLLSPANGSGNGFIIHDYKTVDQAKQAADDATGSNDAYGRIKEERYESSPQYQIDQARQKELLEQRMKKRLAAGCKENPFTPGQPSKCNALSLSPGYSLSDVMSVTSVSTARLLFWDARIISEPCIKQD